MKKVDLEIENEYVIRINQLPLFLIMWVTVAIYTEDDETGTLGNRFSTHLQRKCDQINNFDSLTITHYFIHQIWTFRKSMNKNVSFIVYRYSLLQSSFKAKYDLLIRLTNLIIDRYKLICPSDWKHYFTTSIIT